MEPAERAKQYRAHAEEIRGAARDVKDTDSRNSLIRLAETYEKLAVRLEGDPGPSGPLSGSSD